jgi:hypothetical protein
MLPDSHKAQAVKALSANCCSRCMQQFKTRSALLRHLESKLTDCHVAAAEGGMNLPRSALVELAQKRTYHMTAAVGAVGLLQWLKQ